ncbi:MAG: 2'-5' RNA ligase family protein [Bacteroidetes bacterium]|nr:2'-5' RNA ligase family protein [Bacteroidota bacterium]
MSGQKNLYFIAIVPNLSVRELIKALKEEMKERFNSKHALKSPAHITLQMPFKRSQDFEVALVNTLKTFANRQQAFLTELSGFGCFSPRVLFVKVNDHKPIAIMCRDLKKVLSDTLDFKSDKITSKFHPHMTIATRDLSKLEFNKAWPEYEKRKFSSSFWASGISLLKHNGKHWEIHREFSFHKQLDSHC